MSRPDTAAIVFGTMRMREKAWTVPAWCHFFDGLYDAGVRALHVSSEYESYPLLCEVLAERRSQGRPPFSVYVKMGEPSFDDSGFDAGRFVMKIKAYCRDLGVDRLDYVQWMWRMGLKDDAGRRAAFRSQAEAINEAVEVARQVGHLGSFLCFPYTPEFAAEALELPFVDGLTVYRNVGEREYNEACQQAQELKKLIVAIRPYGAGNLFAQGYTVEDMLDHVFSAPAVGSMIITATEPSNLSALIRYCDA